MDSSSRIVCFQCEESSCRFDHFKNGWRLRNDEFSQLCLRCASIYENGIFCESFHSTDDGWRDCIACGKLLHCGCIVSFNAYLLLLDFGGVICMECSRIDYGPARRRCVGHESRVALGSYDMTGQNPIDVQNWPRCTEDELQEILQLSDCIVIPLFEKRLSTTDVDHNLARLILPKNCAEVFFPAISESRGLPLKIRDAEGKDWEFNYRYWINSGSKMYIMEGIREFMISKRWQASDTVTFFKVQPVGRLVIGLRKGSGNQSPPNEN